jgi:histidinol-phosphate aminotransferase
MGPSPKAQAAMASAIEKVNEYPSSRLLQVREAIAKQHNLNVNNIICSNGSEELLMLIAKCFAGNNDEILMFKYSFLVYRIAALAAGATPVLVEQPDLSMNADRLLEKVTSKTKVIYIDNPSNPVGGYLPYQEVLKIHQNISKSTVLVLDGAYLDYMRDVEDYDPGFKLVEEYENVIVTNTFSKAYALAGLRAGWGYASDKVVDYLNRIRPPFNVNKIAQAAMIASINDQEWLFKSCDETKIQREIFIKNLRNIGLDPLPAYSNFVLVRFPVGSKCDAQHAYRYMGERGVMLRPVAGYGLPEYLRITIGRESDMLVTLRLLTEFMHQDR